MDGETVQSAGWLAAVLIFLGVLLRMIGPWRKQITETEERLRNELRSALEAERKAHAEEIKAHALERDDMGDRIAKMEKLLTRQQLRHNAERALDRHRLNNMNACFDALLLLLKANPDKSAEAVAMVEELRAKQMLAEAKEKAIIRAAEIKVDGNEQDHDGN
jgi:hypothetical protein